MAQTAAELSYTPYHRETSAFSGIFSWIFSTDHKRIGILYMISVLTMFIGGLCLGLLIRLELIAPGATVIDAPTYNAVFTLHGVIMIFLFIIPGIPAIFGNFIMPLQIGAEDVAFPRLNLLSWWLYISGAALLIIALFTGDKLPDTGWTFYAPYSTATEGNISLAVFAAFVLGFSSILTGLNFITTIHRLRAPGMTWFRMPLFCWGLYATAWIQVLATPVVGITLLLVILERGFGVGVFDPAIGGDPVLYQHLFWIYSHPAVYIMILPGMGVISDLLPAFTKRTIFGYKAIAFSTVSIAVVGYMVWGHHMFTSGMSGTAQIVFSFLTFLVAIPTGIKIFNWIASLYKGSIELRAPMLYTLSFIFLFSIGGLTGLVLGALATDMHVHDTYFVVGHFHYVMFGGLGIALFGAMHYWFPKMFGKMYNEAVAVVAWALIFVGFNVLYFPMFILGWNGMPRRYYDYLPEFQYWHVVSTIGSWILALGIFMMLFNLIRGITSGEKAEDNPWGASTLEWTVPSPPPLLNFLEPPHVTHGAYDFEAMNKGKKDSKKKKKGKK
ncbi:cytochrome c oxidase subunit I [Candidatus Uabimicrobium amorphum]|uniref:Cytochrome c oxidase subunit 1 n=1 Tax=Uabimicrobium amorphum TaxID=2596890 RepID=A0A5S9F6U5_UABAM|nr:cytochrome c oxidase subunit I [Candidatus Uabimicrobium amorphum]BBM87004.1 cytochrome c oxidase subunit 1 [Candidatus Uabimicrobium amorphum]